MRRSLSPILWLGLGACTPVCAQHWTTEQARALAAQVRSIDTDSVFTDCDWSALAADLEGKDIVLIGEPDHGSKEVADLRNSLIAELHAKHGFDVVLLCKPPLKQVQVSVETPNLDQDEEEQIHRDADRSDTARA